MLVFYLISTLCHSEHIQNNLCCAEKCCGYRVRFWILISHFLRKALEKVLRIYLSDCGLLSVQVVFIHFQTSKRYVLTTLLYMRMYKVQHASTLQSFYFHLQNQLLQQAQYLLKLVLLFHDSKFQNFYMLGKQFIFIN